jgi:hypothetical protein
MKVYVVLPGIDYEGFGDPVGVFSTKEKAEKVKETTMDWEKKKYAPDYCDIFEIELDE